MNTFKEGTKVRVLNTYPAGHVKLDEQDAAEHGQEHEVVEVSGPYYKTKRVTADPSYPYLYHFLPEELEAV